jgi:GNAT superfamily N-acetyltransferase
MTSAGRDSVVTFWSAPPADGRSDVTIAGRRVVFQSDVSPEPSTIRAIATTTGLTPAEVEERLAAGATWLGLEWEDVVASFGWMSAAATTVGELGLQFAPEPESAYVWDCVTLPAFRGQGLYRDLLLAARRAIRPPGTRLLWIATAWDNWRSIAGIIHAGFQPVGAVATRASNWEHVLIPASEAPVELVRELERSILADGEHRQGTEGAHRGRRFFAANRRTLERPGARAVDPNVREAS